MQIVSLGSSPSSEVGNINSNIDLRSEFDSLLNSESERKFRTALLTRKLEDASLSSFNSWSVPITAMAVELCESRELSDKSAAYLLESVNRIAADKEKIGRSI